MFKTIIEASVRFRWIIVLVTALVAALGLYELTRLPIDAVPDITNRQVQITTVAPALSPEQMERQVTYPVETAMAGLPGLENTRSLTRNGFSQVTVVFTDATDIYFARQQVAERLASVRDQLPENVEPAMAPISTGLGEVLMWTVDYAPFTARTVAAPGRPGWQAGGDYLTPEGERLTTPQARATYLRTVQDWIVAPRMRSVEGLAGVDVNGGYVKEYAVRPDPARLARYGLGLDDLTRALQRANTQAGAGFVQRSGEALTVRADALAATLDDLAQAPVVNRGGLVVRVADVATVEIGRAPRLGAASHDGHEAVLGTALMRAGDNSRTVAEAAARALKAIAPSLPPSVVAEPVLKRSDLVNATIATVFRNLAEGALLVVVVLFLLLGNMRAATIAALMIPISFLFAVIGMNRFGISGNLMSLGALDFGLMVDGAVVVVENTLLTLSHRRASAGRPLTPAERLDAAVAAARQMVKPAVFGQLIILLVFTPLLLLEGVEGKTFIPMGATVMLALVGAFLFSFTFVPAMAALLVRDPAILAVNDRGAAREHETRVLRILRRWIEPVIGGAVARPKVVLIAAAASLVLGAAAFLSLGREFIPTLDEGNIAMQALRAPSTSLEQSIAMQMVLEREVIAQPEVRTIFSRAGTAQIAVDAEPPNIADSVIVLKDRKDWPDPRLSKEALIERIEQAASLHIGNAFEFSQPIELRFNELISGVRSDVAVMVHGDDFAALERTADAVAQALRQTPGAADVQVEQATGLPTLQVSVDRLAAASFGLSAADVTGAVSKAVGGAQAGHIFEGDRRFSVVVRLAEAHRNDPAAFAALPVTNASGVSVPLSSVARIEIRDGQNQISRDNGSRRLVVQANVRGRDLGGFVSDAKGRVESQVSLPAGYSLKWGGQFVNLERAEKRLGLIIPVVFVLIGGLLFLALGSAKEAALVFASVPLALVGGALALLLRGMPFSVSAAVGFIAVSGVATLNGLVLMQAIGERIVAGAAPLAAAVEGATSRLRAVLTTALVAIVGFIPMAIARGAGAEVQKPLATVVIGGLVTATALTLLVLPTFAARAVSGARRGLPLNEGEGPPG